MSQGIEYKQVIIVRTDLKMSVGKIAGQVAHAAIAATKHQYCTPEIFDKWFNYGLDQTKIILAVDNIDELISIFDEVYKSELPFALIWDKGKTEIPAGTLTCMAIGPANTNAVDKITRNLRLLK